MSDSINVFFKKTKKSFKTKGINYANTYISYLRNYSGDYIASIGLDKKEAIKIAESALRECKLELDVKRFMSN